MLTLENRIRILILSSILALPILFGKSKKRDYNLLLIILFWVVLVVFSLVKTKIVHYSSLCYFPISYLAAITLYRIYCGEIDLKKIAYRLILIIGFFYSLVPVILRLIVSPELNPILQNYVHDDFALACINTSVNWNGWEFIPGLALGISLLVSLFLKGIKRLMIVYCSTIFSVFLVMLLVVPKIEKYSQGPAIQFITDLKDQNVWISTLGYKSYAPFFYSDF